MTMRADRLADRKCQRGFTLMEAVLVIMLTGVGAAMVGVFIRAPITGYVDQARRAELSDAADTALRRIAREVQRALPNSVRVDATGKVLEFLPVSDGGRYRAAPEADLSGDFLDFDSTTDGSFQVLGPNVDVASGSHLVVYNLGLPGADAYSGESRRALTSTGSGLSTLSYTVGGTQFPFASPSNRFQVIATPVTFLCSPLDAAGDGSLRRYGGYPIQAAQPTSASAAPLSGLSGNDNALLTNNAASCTFDLSAASERNGLLTLTLTLSSGGESVVLMHQLHLDNSP
jgi:MSHA biogenesis protein MshO